MSPTVQVAQGLIGKIFCVRDPRGTWLAAEITETEAYLGSEDPASHAYRGPTERNQSMFENGGTCYVYLSYGVNYCMNVSTGEKGIGHAVLLRSGRPLAGLEMMMRRRKKRGLPDLLSGPGKFTQALGVSLNHNGMRFDRPDFKIVEPEKSLSVFEIGCSSRIGISKAKESLFRFFIQGSDWLSR